MQGEESCGVLILREEPFDVKNVYVISIPHVTEGYLGVRVLHIDELHGLEMGVELRNDCEVLAKKMPSDIANSNIVG